MTDTGDTAGTWTITGFNYLQDLTDGTSIKVKFSTGPAAANQLNTLDIGIASENTAITSTTKVVFLEYNKPLVVEENINPDSYLKAGDEYFLTYRLEAGYVNGSLVDGWIMERSNDAYARQLFTLTGDTANTYIQANENFYSVKEVAAHGTGNTTSGISSIVDNLTTDSQTDALSARQGMILYSGLTGKQDTIIFTGNNATLKTINGQSLQGPGNLIIQGGEGTGGTYYYEGSGITISTANTISIADYTWEVINNKYDKTGGTVSGSVIALEEVSAHGSGGTQSSVQSVIDNLLSTSQTDALSANQGRILNNTKQATLVSGVNIKTINNQSLLGEGNITIQGGGGTGGTEYNAGTGITISSDTISISQSTWDKIDSKYDKTGGTVSGSVIALEEVSAHGSGNSATGISSIVDNLNSTSATDALSANQGRVLKNSVNTKQDQLVSGVNIKTINGSAITGSGNLTIQSGGGGTTYSAGSGITISSDTISISNATWQTINNKYDKTGGTVNGDVIATGNISAHGSGGTQSSVQSVIDNLNSNSSTDALSAKQGKVLDGKVANKQDTLVSGVNIKTINGSAITGSGNLVIQGGGGSTGGTTYYAGTNIEIVDYVINVTGITASSHPSMTAGTANYAVSAGSATSATSATNATNATYATYLGTSQSNYSKSSLDTALAGKLGTGDTAVNSDKLDGQHASYFVNTATTQTISGVKTFTDNIIGEKDISAHGSGGTQSSVQSVIDSITTTASSITAVSAVDALSYRQGVVLNNKITGLTSTKQDKLVSGTNIKTINGNSILGSGNLVIEGGGGSSYSAGANISIQNNIISVTGITANSLSQLTAGTASYAAALGTSSANYTKSSLDTALGNKLGKTETAADSTKWGGYKIVVGSIGSASDTIYFGT